MILNTIRSVVDGKEIIRQIQRYDPKTAPTKRPSVRSVPIRYGLVTKEISSVIYRDVPTELTAIFICLNTGQPFLKELGIPVEMIHDYYDILKTDKLFIDRIEVYRDVFCSGLTEDQNLMKGADEYR